MKPIDNTSDNGSPVANELAKQLLEMIEKAEFPTSEELTPEALKIYYTAHDVLLMYRGHPDVLLQALHIFMMTGVAPYAYAGAANIIMTGSYLSGGNYDEWGVKEGKKLLDKAIAMAPYRFEIDMITARMYNMLGQKQEFRNAIDDLAEYPNAREQFYFASLELSYWGQRSNIAHIERWAKRAQVLATSKPQVLYALGKLANAYHEQSRYQQSIATYRTIVKMDPGDAWAWHNMSIIYLNQNDIMNAFDCNRNALSIMDFGVAQNMQEHIIRKLNPHRHDDLIDEVEPFPILQAVQGQQKPKARKKGLFGSLFGGN